MPMVAPFSTADAPSLTGVGWRVFALDGSAALLFAVTALAPLFFGSESPFMIACWIAILSASVAAGLIAAPHKHRVAMGLVASVALAYALIAFAQIAGSASASKVAGVWSALHETGIDASASGLVERSHAAIADGQPIQALGLVFLAALAAMAGIAAASDKERLRRLIFAFGWYGPLYALFCLASFILAPGYIFWWHKIAHVTDLTGTFYNRNTAAVFIGLGLVVNAARIAAYVDRIYPARARGHAVSTTWPLWLHSACCLVCLAALVFTNSRAGMLLCLLSCALAVAIRLRRRAGKMLERAALAGFAVTILLILAVTFAEHRISESAFADGGRVLTYQATLQMILAQPWFGIGLGCFAWAFPLWRLPEQSMWGIWDRAHNSPLELMAEIGIPAGGLTIIAWGVLLALMARNAWRRGTMETIVSFCIVFIGLAHCLVDFSIQIPGFAIAFYGFAGMGIGLLCKELPAGRLDKRVAGPG